MPLDPILPIDAPIFSEDPTERSCQQCLLTTSLIEIWEITTCFSARHPIPHTKICTQVNIKYTIAQEIQIKIIPYTYILTLTEIHPSYYMGRESDL